MTYKRAYIEITNACNRRCAFCPPHHRPERYLSPPEFAHILDAAAPFVRHLYFHLKGEPLLHPRVADMAALAQRRGFFVNLTTNGDLLGRRPGLYRHLRQLNVSLHGHEDPEPLVERLITVRDAHPALRICLRLWDGGRGAGAPALKRFGLSAGHGPRATLGENLFLSRADPFEWPDLSRPPLWPEGYCHGLSQQFGVLVSGDVTPCCLDGEGDIPLGNIFTQNLSEILSSPRSAAIREGFRRRTAVEALCRTCSYKNRF